MARPFQVHPVVPLVVLVAFGVFVAAMWVRKGENPYKGLGTFLVIAFAGVFSIDYLPPAWPNWLKILLVFVGVGVVWNVYKRWRWPKE